MNYYQYSVSASGERYKICLLFVCLYVHICLSYYTFSTANWTAHNKIPKANAICHRRKVICFMQHDTRIPSTAHHVAHQWQEGE